MYASFSRLFVKHFRLNPVESMQVLTRIISQYDGPNFFLGIFTTEERAFNAREEYLKRMALHDPWAIQAYRTVNLNSDVQLITIEDRRNQSNESQVVFLVTAYFEGMGQVRREFLAVFSERIPAMEFATRAEEGPFESAPNWCDVDEVILDAPR